MIKFKKSLGQNFLKNEMIADEIVAAADLSKKDTVLEIGPGAGILTQRLTKIAGQVFAVEKDFDLVDKLRRGMGQKNLKLIHQDALWFDPSLLGNFKIVANIPYNITSAIIRTILIATPPASRAILMVQREVAQRMIAKAGDMNLLALSVQLYGNVRKCFDVAPGSFTPRPNVTSAVIEITHFTKNNDNRFDPEIVLSFARIAFAKKRKLLASNLAESTPHSKSEIVIILESCGIRANARAQDLSVRQWIDLASKLQ